MQKERVMLRAAGGIPYELTRGRVKRLNLHVRRDGTVALSIPLRTTLEAADAYVIAEAEWIRAAQARQAAREKRQEELPDKARMDLTAILRDADLVKFAKATPDGEQNEADYLKAFYFVEETKLVVEEEEPEQPDPMQNQNA